jgi:hypothetical protein
MLVTRTSEDTPFRFLSNLTKYSWPRDNPFLFSYLRRVTFCTERDERDERVLYVEANF